MTEQLHLVLIIGDNKITTIIDDILAKLFSTKFESSIDLCSAYWQIEMDENDIQKTTFYTLRECYEFMRMLFGLVTAPPPLCFKGLQTKYWMVFNITVQWPI